MSAPTLYEQILGPAYERLPRAVQRFHRLRGAHLLHGSVETQRPQTWPARCLAWGLGAPRTASQGALRFELEVQPEQEVWTRHFPTRRMRSTLRWAAGGLEEQLGWARLRFALHATPSGLNMQLTGVHFLGLPCPRWLLPAVVAEETGDGDRFQFRIDATVPFIGRVAAYRGHLDLPTEPVR